VTATLDERTVAVTDQDVSRFYQAAQEHTDRPGDRDGRTRAGLAAVLAGRETEPRADPEIDVAGLVVTASLQEKDRLVRSGWSPLGASTFYVLAPPGMSTADSEP
jgi:hypothetical protein